MQNGYDATLCFIIQRDDCDYFKPSNVDQFYYAALKKAKIRNKTEWTGFLDEMTIKDESRITAEKI